MYGILRSETNTGLTSELLCLFSAPLSIRSKQPAFASDTLSLKRKTIQTNYQRWEIDTAIAPLDPDFNILGHTVKMGYTKSFPIRMPQPVFPAYRAIPKTLMCNVSQAAGLMASQVYLTNSNPSFALPANSFIRFHGHSKVYLITDTQIVTGKNLITITPSLVGSVTLGEDVSVGDNVTMHVFYETDSPLGLSFQDGILADASKVTFVEKL